MQPAAGAPSPGGGPTPAAPAATQAAGNPPVTPPASLGADPAYNAFLAQLGLTDANLRDAAALRTGNLEAGLQPQVDALNRNQGHALDRNTANYNARGLVNSSDDINAANQIRQGYGDRVAALQGNVGNQIAAIYQQLATQLANGQVNASARGTAALGNGAVANALAGPNPYLAALGAAK